MLLELNIKNFAIIDDMNITFTKGLNILTGETGSGKSIIIEALGIILGGRGNKNLIKEGEEKAILQALFTIEKNEKVKKILKKYSIEVEDGLLLFTRDISENHPSISRINGTTVTLNVLREISSSLIDIFAQQEHQSLLDINNHIRIIDNFGDENFNDIKKKIEEKYKEYKHYISMLDNLDIDPIKRKREIELLKFQISEIEDANLTLEDEEELENEFKKLSKSQQISDNLQEVVNYLNGTDFDSVSIINLINSCISKISEVAKYDTEYSSILENFKSINYELQDINSEINHNLELLDINLETIFNLEQRVNLVNSLRKKYGLTISDILSYKEKIEKELATLLNYDKEVANLEESILTLREELEDLSDILSSERKSIAEIFEIQIAEELKDLNMRDVVFKVKFEKSNNPKVNGMDDVEFLISTNKGTDLKPLVEIVSGGEMSRIMLGFKTILSEHDLIPTLVFDEIDTGISGRTAQVVGEKIAKIGRKRQVITITHLPQIAALADSHYSISKNNVNDFVITSIERLDEEERVYEMARLLGGVDLTQTTLNHAKEMLIMSENLKNNF